ncbi:MAG: putative epimerase/dehydratase [Chloroflexi bacterium ADurb.Bin325]|nr:MAG: putative epimerase/dehydratase [Chloroflexi bacterium ADurb.Bin325]
MTTKRILVTGAGGQIGTELVTALRSRYGDANVVATDIQPLPAAIREAGPTARLDVTQADALAELVRRCDIDTIYHMAAILSATGEEKPRLAWNVNIGGLYNVLEVARELGVRRIYNPSSIAAFGPETPKVDTPQETVLRPTTMYGVTKVAGEMLGAYYHRRYGLDVRGIRYPGVISSETLPGGGTTDYAVEIFYEAIRHRRYTCFVRADTVLPMIYMPDCIRATLMLMEADAERLIHAAEYNLASLSFSAGELAAAIARHIPDFVCEYRPDFRQQIADSWPQTIDDSAARMEWGWQPEYDLDGMVADMLAKLTPRLAG